MNQDDAVAVLMPGVPDIYWALLGAMSAGIMYPINWMAGPRQTLHFLRKGNVKAILALGPTPGFTIWENLMSVLPELPSNIPVWSVQGPDGKMLAEFDLDASLASQTPKASLARRFGDDIAAYVHSGGTTGAPKIVKLSHRGMSYRHWTMQLSQHLSVGEICIHDTPMFHVGGLIGRTLSALASGASLVIPTVMGARDRRYLANYWRFVEKYRNHAAVSCTHHARDAVQIAASGRGPIIAQTELHRRVDCASDSPAKRVRAYLRRPHPQHLWNDREHVCRRDRAA